MFDINCCGRNIETENNYLGQTRHSETGGTMILYQGSLTEKLEECNEKLIHTHALGYLEAYFSSNSRRDYKKKSCLS